ncbi:unnamed protein product, partial [Orchesella dallaii]
INAKSHTEECPLWPLRLHLESTKFKQHPSSHFRKPYRKKHEPWWHCTRLVAQKPIKFLPLVPYSSKGNALILEAQEYIGIHKELAKLSSKRKEIQTQAQPKSNPPQKHVTWALKTDSNAGKTPTKTSGAEVRRKDSPFRFPKSFDWYIMNPEQKLLKRRRRRSSESRPLCLRPPFRMKTYPFRNRLDGFSELANLLQETHEGVELLYDESCCLASLGPQGIEKETKRFMKEEANASQIRLLRDQEAMESEELAWNLLARRYSFSFVPSLTSVKETEVEIIYQAKGEVWVHGSDGNDSETEMEPELNEEPPEAKGWEGDEEDCCAMEDEEPSNGNLHYWQ